MSIKYLSLGGIIMDDIVFPDGRTMMNTLGGGGLYAAAGMRCWSPDVGLFARVGPDFDRDLLAGLRLNEDQIQITRDPTPRAWQLYEEDGTRTQIPRVPPDVWRAQLAPQPDSVDIQASMRGVHMSGRGDPGERETVAQFADAGLTISLEPIVDDDTTPAERERVLELLSFVDIFSPALSDARRLAGEESAETLMRRLAARGPRFVALRRGEAGSLVYDREAERAWEVPAAPAEVVDVTGAGNAFCGGFLVGWLERGDVRHAAACAAVSAAITIEQVGPPQIASDLLADAEARRDDLLPEIKPGRR